MSSDLLAGRRIGVASARDPFGEGLLSGLEDLGGRVTFVAPPSLGNSREAWRDAVMRVGPVEGLVYATIDPLAAEPLALESTDATAWDRRCESVLRTTLWFLQGAHAALRGNGGAVVLVTSSIGLTGMPGLAPFATAVEGQRALAKSAARQWAATDIVVNCVAAAIDGSVDARTDIAPVVAALLAPAMAAVRGATLVVDGGVLMMP